MVVRTPVPDKDRPTHTGAGHHPPPPDGGLPDVPNLTEDFERGFDMVGDVRRGRDRDDGRYQYPLRPANLEHTDDWRTGGAALRRHAGRAHPGNTTWTRHWGWWGWSSNPPTSTKVSDAEARTGWMRSATDWASSLAMSPLWRTHGVLAFISRLCLSSPIVTGVAV